MTTETAVPFALERLGVIMRPDPANPREAWGVLNPGGVRGRDDAYYLFPRLVGEGNYSRIGKARVTFNATGVPTIPTGAERLGYALEPHEDYEVTRGGGGVEDPRVTYLAPLDLFVMTYTAYTPHHPRIALAVSRDLQQWRRLGLVRYAVDAESGHDLNECGNKDGIIMPDVVRDPLGRPSIALLHRPTYSIRHRYTEGATITSPPSGAEHLENIWISFIPLDTAMADVARLTEVSQHQLLMEPRAEWEQLKIGGGAPPVRLPYGWLFIYHGVSGVEGPTGKQVRYCAGAAVLDLEDPTRVLYRSPRPILEPLLPNETEGIVPGVVFPTATDRRDDGTLDVYYGGADSVVAAARMAIPAELPTTSG